MTSVFKRFSDLRASFRALCGLDPDTGREPEPEPPPEPAPEPEFIELDAEPAAPPPPPEPPKRSGLALAELAQFCHVDRSCVIVAKDGRVDTHATAVAEGRRETFLKIQQMLNLTDAQLMRLRSDEEME